MDHNVYLLCLHSKGNNRHKQITNMTGSNDDDNDDDDNSMDIY